MERVTEGGNGCSHIPSSKKKMGQRAVRGVDLKLAPTITDCHLPLGTRFLVKVFKPYEVCMERRKRLGMRNE